MEPRRVRGPMQFSSSALKSKYNNRRVDGVKCLMNCMNIKYKYPILKIRVNYIKDCEANHEDSTRGKENYKRKTRQYIKKVYKK